MIDFDAVKVMGQDLVQRPLEQARMGRMAVPPAWRMRATQSSMLRR